ncbi:uncharacterized protein LOC115881749 [Sitophilus oryzae]|uniref:Uncharacterized protein LOC115881749 n=1 Tax=Sitophilus oryzae TaxID=7048 RepID=A0A6J2XUP4_SITOR|nr:uncharacterized protein LOC115881749 [Sitophilus oryzae]
MNKAIFVILVAFGAGTYADKDDKRWVWSGNGRSNENARNYNGGGVTVVRPQTKYNVYEDNDYRPNAPINGDYFTPNVINQGSLVLNERPPLYENRPPVSGVGFLPENRPGGVYNNINRPSYGGSGPYIPEGDESPGILTGPVPSWVKEGPFKEFDKCKCTEKFNCNSPGISYGHCDTGKSYCCYSTKKLQGGPLPSKPVHSIENGILVGPGGPVDPIPGVASFNKPPKQFGGAGYYRPGGFQGQYNNHGSNYAGIRGEPNEYSPANGILVGPGGPYDRPGAGFLEARSGIASKKA